MTTRQMYDLFNSHHDKFLDFKDIALADRLSQRPDMHAFILLDRIIEPERVNERAGDFAFDMVDGTEHDKIYLRVDVKALAEVITEENVIALVRCGISYDYDHETLWMFV